MLTFNPKGQRSEPLDGLYTCHMGPMDSEMAGPTRLKFGGLVEGMVENILAKKSFGFVNMHQDQVGGPQVPLLGHGDKIETPNLACRGYWP